MRSATSEQVIQRAVCQHLRQRSANGVVWWHTPNGGRRSPIEAAIFKGLGVCAGVSDLILGAQHEQTSDHNLEPTHCPGYSLLTRVSQPMLEPGGQKNLRTTPWKRL